MEGRVLSEEEIRDVEAWASHAPKDYDMDLLNLIATIRDRDRVIAELRENYETLEGVWRHQQYLDGMRQEQNTIMRETLKTIRDGTTTDIEALGLMPWEIAREALAKTSGGDPIE